MHTYKSLDPDQQQELFSQFLVSDWSYSKITSFARNEKAFEMNYIFGVYSKNSSSTIAGQAYHHALQYYFQNKKDGKILELVELEQSAFGYIENVGANQWKIQKTTPSIEDCQQKAFATVSALLRNFYSEKSVYEENCKQIMDVEMIMEEWVTVNGVEIPLPCRAKIDLVIETLDGKIVIIDHKSKQTFTSEEEMALGIGVQAITYIKCLEERTGAEVNEVWFIENKYSQNKDKSPQLNCFKLSLNADTRRLYEALLYEPLKRMIAAVHDPDYVYLINDSDNFVDKAELYDFWARTMISEVEDFNVDETKKAIVGKRLKKIRDASIQNITPNVIKEFKRNAASFIQYDLSVTNMTAEEKIEHVLRSFGTIVRVAHKFDGYSSNTYLLEVSAGVPVKSIYGKRLDIANALDVANVRMSQAMVVHENKSYLAIDFSKKRERDLFFDAAELKDRRIPIGKDNFQNTIVWDLDNQSTPHALVCGATGSGKSVLIKSILEYALLAKTKRIIVLDPKYEFLSFGRKNVEVYNEIEDIELVMENLVFDMNKMVRLGKTKSIMVVFDEFADAVASSKKKTLEENLRILLQKGRSCGIRIVAATQRASVKVITGDAKVNFPVLICFKVPKEIDSKVVLDEAGAESLAGRGDGLLRSPEYPETVRFQAFYKPN